MDNKEIKFILDKQQEYLNGLCDNAYGHDDMFMFGFGHCLRKIANDFGFDKDEYGATIENTLNDKQK